MDIDQILGRSFGDCPSGSSFTSCGGPDPFWRGCCSGSCTGSDGCPSDAKISIQISSGEPWPTFTKSSSSHRATSGVGSPVTGDSPATTSSTVATTSATNEPSVTSEPANIIASSTLSSTLVATATLVAHVSEDGSGRLSKGAAAGIGVGSAVVAVGMFVAIFFLCRRRKHAKRMSSYRENLHDEYKEKDQPVDYHSTAARGTGDVFAPFGGRATSFKTPKPVQTATPFVSQSLTNRRDEISPISSSPSPIQNSFVSPITPQFTSSIREEEPSGNRDIIRSSTPDEPAQRESRPRCYELDSAGTARSNYFELPAPIPASAAPQATYGVCHDAASDNPEALMPGSFPDVVKNAQRQKFTRVQSGVAAVVSVGPKSQHSRPSSFDNPSHLRATMNATADDVKQNRHVNSWTHL